MKIKENTKKGKIPVDNITRFPTERKHLTMEEMAKRAHLGEPKTVTVKVDGDWG